MAGAEVVEPWHIRGADGTFYLRGFAFALVAMLVTLPVPPAAERMWKASQESITFHGGEQWAILALLFFTAPVALLGNLLAFIVWPKIVCIWIRGRERMPPDLLVPLAALALITEGGLGIFLWQGFAVVAALPGMAVTAVLLVIYRGQLEQEFDEYFARLERVTAARKAVGIVDP